MRTGLAAVGCLLLGCTSSGSFACQDDVDCGEGVCEVTGYCSFADPSCDSGRRYGDLAEQGLAGQCVAVDEGSTSGEVPTSSSGQPTTSAVTTLEPTTSTSTTVDPSAEGSTTDEPGTEDSSSTTSEPVCGDGEAAAGEDCFDADVFEDYPIMPFAVDISAGDFENLGTVGIAAVANDAWAYDAETGWFCFYPSDGIGGYAAGSCRGLDSPAYRTHILDGNGDGNYEAVLLRQESIDTVRETGGFYDITSFGSFGTGEWGLSELVFSDFDGDGFQDVAYSWAYGYRVRRGTNAGMRYALQPEVEIGSIPGEGAAGITLVPADAIGVPGTNWVALFLNRYLPEIVAGHWGDAGFTAAPKGSTWSAFEGCGVGTGSRHAILADLDGDGPDDLVVTCNNGSFVALRWDGSTFTSQQITLAGAYRPVGGDIDRDGDQEVLIISDELGVAVLYAFDGDELSIAHQFEVPGLHNAGVLADLDDDGALDVALAFTDESGVSPEGGLRVWLQNP